MSLKHILNDEPTSPVPHRSLHIPQAQPSVEPPGWESTLRSPQESYQSTRGQSGHARADPPLAKGHAYDTPRWQPTGSERWLPDSRVSGPSSHAETHYTHEQNGSTSPDWSGSGMGQQLPGERRRTSTSPARKRHRISDAISPAMRRVRLQSTICSFNHAYRALFNRLPLCLREGRSHTTTSPVMNHGTAATSYQPTHPWPKTNNFVLNEHTMTTRLTLPQTWRIARKFGPRMRNITRLRESGDQECSNRRSLHK
jgi:hypothetical protein